MNFYPNNPNMFNGMDMQQLMIQQQYLNNALQREQNRQEQMQRQQMNMNNRLNQPNQQSEALIPGRMIGVEEEIVPNEVPMDGRVAIFPKKDFSSIFAKAWNSNGTIQTVEYIPKPTPTSAVTPVATEESMNDVSNQILERLDNIEKMLSNNKEDVKTNIRQNNNKKEPVKDE